MKTDEKTELKCRAQQPHYSSPGDVTHQCFVASSDLSIFTKYRYSTKRAFWCQWH